MQPNIPRDQLEQCLSALAHAEASDEMRSLAQDLLESLLRLQSADRLTKDVFMLALDSLALIPDLEPHIAGLKVHAGTSRPAELE
ncbi:hypothetical protein [Pseudorhodoferax soli]|uniref:Uncharacterized protein n=1 Tax=Pseudorhodoferax soli TaxID=545864 RepID=A0A368X6S6_9BURK|nr:hypothetical protein [Pseudorhodoferax soli]RCW63643.1 hypothetical protein DES41_11839 [Pseudorhodoferax soli]